jgi:EspG family
MARLDRTRTAVELTEEELAVIGLLLTSPDDRALKSRKSKALQSELEQAGIVVDGQLEGYAARLMAVIGEPDLRLVIERFTTDEPRPGPFAAVRDDAGVWAETTRDGATDFTPIEPSLIPWAVARAVGLGPRDEANFDGRLELTGRSLQLALDRLTKGDVEKADDELLRTTSLDASEREVLCKLLVDRRLSWRAFSVWHNAAGEPEVVAVAVVDGGESGFWLSSHEPPGADDAVVVLEPTSAGEVWERIVALVPLPVPTGAGGGVDG